MSYYKTFEVKTVGFNDNTLTLFGAWQWGTSKSFKQHDYITLSTEPLDYKDPNQLVILAELDKIKKVQASIQQTLANSHDKPNYWDTPRPEFTFYGKNKKVDGFFASENVGSD